MPGPPALPVLCTKCRTHWIKPTSKYYARQVGPVCGGVIRSGRRAVPRPVAVRAAPKAEVGEGQMDLFDEEKGV